MLLVAVVVLVFLQNWRSAIIPLVAVPVAIIGTFAAMAVMGFSLNTLSLFGLVLAIGIVVDDAIVVVEATEHHIEQGMAPRAAAHQAMAEVSAPVFAIGLVLTCVFLPCVFISGITGLFFRQFALTIAVSTVLSTINSLTLSPALCAILLKPRGAHRDPLSWLLNILLGWFFKGFNKAFAWSTAGYIGIVGKLLRVSVLVLLVYGGLLYLTVWSFGKIPTGFIPAQDQGYLFTAIQLPDSSSMERTEAVAAKATEVAASHQGNRPCHQRHRLVVHPGGQRLAPGHDVHRSRSVRQAGNPRPERRCDRAEAARRVLTRRFPRPTSSCSALRPCAVSATPAASKS